MKKFYYLLLLFPLSLLMSCDKEDFSPVDMTIELTGVSIYENNFYTVSGNVVGIENLSVKSIDGKNTALSNVFFSLNGVPIIGEPGSDNIAEFDSENLPAGTYSLNVTGNLLQVDSSIKMFAVNFPIIIVSSEDELPSGIPEIGSYSYTIRISE